MASQVTSSEYIPYVCAVCKTETEYMEFSIESTIADTQKRVSVCSKKCFIKYRHLLNSVKKLHSDIKASITHK